MQIVGYTDRWSVRPRQSIGLHVSCRSGAFDVSVIQLRHGDDNPAGPGFRATAVPTQIDGAYVAQWHDVPAGSYAHIDEAGSLLNSSAATVAVWIYPTIVGGQQQAIVSRGVNGFKLYLDADGKPCVSADSTRVEAPSALLANHWYLLVARLDRAANTVELIVLDRDEWPGGLLPVSWTSR